MNSLDKDVIKRAIEAIVFASDEPVSADELSVVFPDINVEEITNCLDELLEEWNGAERGFKFRKIAGGYQFRTLSRYSEYIVSFNRDIREIRLSRAALEVLAIVAYKQPVTRAEVEDIRGVDSFGVINSLLDKKLLSIEGRKEVIGRPFLYSTTQQFLETFNLGGLDDLPTLKEFEEIEKSMVFKDNIS